MADPNVINIKTLPRVEEVVNGNLLIVETEQGTNTIDFSNFVVGPNNVSFYTQITNLSAQNISLSASTTQLVNTQINSLSATTSASLSTLDSRITSLSTSVSQQLTGIYYRSDSTTVNAGSLTAPVINFSVPSNVFLSVNDINLNFGSNTSVLPALSGVPYAFISNADFSQSGTSIAFTIRITHTALSNITIRYNIFKPYTI